MIKIFKDMTESINQLTDAINQISDKLGAMKEGESDEDVRERRLMSDPRTRKTGLYIIQKTSTLREVAYWIENKNPELSRLGIWKFIGTARAVEVNDSYTTDYGVVKKIDLYEKK